KGLIHVLHGNKAYLRGIRSTGLRANCAGEDAPFFLDALECVGRHAANGDRIVLISGTLNFLAEQVLRRLRTELAKRDLSVEIHVCATRLEEKERRWTGRVLGQPMFGEAKAVAVRWYAEKWQLHLAECAAYGDGALDRWMLSSVGKPFAVNPDDGLRAVAKRRGWNALEWRRASRGKSNLTKIVVEKAR